MMNGLKFPPGSLFRIFFVLIIFLLVAAGCGGAAPSEAEPAMTQPMEEPAVAPEQPLPTQPAIVEITPTLFQSEEIIPTQNSPTIPERRRITLEYPLQIRAGDSDVVRLTLEIDDLGNITPTAQIEGNVVTGEVVEIPDLYETHTVIAEARFDISGLQVTPSGPVDQILSRGQILNFFWSIRPEESGVFRGTIWFYLRFVDKVTGEESQKTVSAQLVEIKAVNFLGLSANVVRTAGGIGSVVGTVIGFPFFEDILKFLLKIRRKNRK